MLFAGAFKSRKGRAKQKELHAAEEYTRTPYDDMEQFFDYLEIAFQFGYVAMFAVVFPLGMVWFRFGRRREVCLLARVCFVFIESHAGVPWLIHAQ